MHRWKIGQAQNLIKTKDMENRIRDYWTEQGNTDKYWYWTKDTMTDVFTGMCYRKRSINDNNMYEFPLKDGRVWLWEPPSQQSLMVQELPEISTAITARIKHNTLLYGIRAEDIETITKNSREMRG